MANKPKLSAGMQSVAGVVVVLVGVGVAAWCFSNAHMFLGCAAVAAMLGALVPLYPPDDPPTGFV